ncbi:hypothetical protein AB0K11_21365 [Mycobacterium sp. NPDC050551]|uniref:hypothetical protein n=1 Tax=Mycobacterium sp. NPDC050551 TaxID=3155407 RepID=UPI003422756A
MRLRRVLAAAVILAGSAVGWAPIAQAQPPDAPPEILQGVYTYNEGGQTGADWTIFPTCVPTVGDLREPLWLPVACRLHVTPERQSGSDAVMTNGLWTTTRKVSDGLKCPDGSTAAVEQIFSWSGTTLAGTRKSIHGAVCGLQPAMTSTPFTLAFKAPLPIPVDRYPLICEPGGLRRCF